MRRIIAVFCTFFLFVLLHPTFTSAQGTFICQCAGVDAAGNCISWQPAPGGISCSNDPVANPVANANTCSGCILGGSECTASCTFQTDIQEIPYGGACNQNNPNLVCGSDPDNPSANVACRQGEQYGGVSRCLRTNNLTPAGQICGDDSECAGFQDGTTCTYMPNSGGATVCATPQQRAQLSCQTDASGFLLCSNNPPPPNDDDDDQGGNGGNGGQQNPGEKAEEVQCEGQPGTIDTAIGCIPINDVAALTSFFLRWALGIAGGVSLMMIGFAGYRIATSQGDPRRLQGGQELLMSAIGGLLMVVLSVYLLRFIGVDLLGLF